MATTRRAETTEGLSRGRYAARPARDPSDRAACLALRAEAFAVDRRDPGGDGFDAACEHVLIEEIATGGPVGTFRLMRLEDGGAVARSYSAQHYDLGALAAYPGRLAELGRFCVDPARRDPDILRVAWGALTRIVDADGAGMLFGCSSFAGTDAAAHRDAFALLAARHLAPDRWRPRRKSPCALGLAEGAPGRTDPRRAAMGLPPLLRSYLAMGGWVSDHAVVDAEMDTMHVFTGLEIGAIPEARRRLLRAVAEGGAPR